jgi:hypothetical protein
VLHRLVVHAEHDVAEQVAQRCLLGVEGGVGRIGIGGLDGEPELDALDAARQEGDRGRSGPCFVERLEARPQVRSVLLTMTARSPDRLRRSGSTARRTISRSSSGTPGRA